MQNLHTWGTTHPTRLKQHTVAETSTWGGHIWHKTGKRHPANVRNGGQAVYPRAP